MDDSAKKEDGNNLMKKIAGFAEDEVLKIKADNIFEASVVLGQAMKEKNRAILEKLWLEVGSDKKEALLLKAKIKAELIRKLSISELFSVDGVNRLGLFMMAFDGYCKGSELSEAEVALMQIEIEGGCQTIFVKDLDQKVIGFVHTEEEGGATFDEKNYDYRWVEMDLPEKKISFLAYPGLCSWGPAFGINETTDTVEAVDDLYIKESYDKGPLWPGAMAFMALDIGDVKKVKELVERIGKFEGRKFVGGYAVHLAQNNAELDMISVEFAEDTIKIVEPEMVGNRKVSAQANCPLDKELTQYSQSAYPTDDVEWNKYDIELFVEMNERQKRTFLEGSENREWPSTDSEKTISEGLRILANPYGDIGRLIDIKTGGFKYYLSGLPTKVTNSHFAGWIGNGVLSCYVGKLVPKPLEGKEYELVSEEESRFALKKIWEEADKVFEEYSLGRVRRKYPWLFLDKKMVISVIYDFDEENGDMNERESVAGSDTENTANELVKALETLGHEVELVPIKHVGFEEQVKRLKGEVIFNQVEEDELGFDVLKSLEGNGKVVTGVDSVGHKLSWDKGKTKELLLQSGVLTPKYLVISDENCIDLKDLSFPFFVKAADDHGSLSINEKSKVNNIDELRSQIRWVRETIGGAALVEEYIDGRELGVTVLGNGDIRVILPIKEIVFGKEFEGRDKVVTFEAKWKANSTDSQGTSLMDCPASLSEKELEATNKNVLKACEALGVRDYARFDIRLKNDLPYIIDYNANPGIGPNDASALPAKRFGLKYEELIAAIVAVALARPKGNN